MNSLFKKLPFWILLTACSRRPSPAVSQLQAVSAAAHIEESFALVTPNMSHVSIQTKALEKEFLLQANLIPQGVAPLGTAIRSRIVSFQKADDRLFLLESSQGQRVAPDLPHHLILASFPIVSESQTNIVFDFNSGMSELFTGQEWSSSDLEHPSEPNSEGSLKVRRSYLRLRALDPTTNRLELRQVAQIELPPSNKETSFVISTVEVAYSLSPYRADPLFKALKNPGFEHVGFFEAPPLVGESGRPVSHVTRFDPSRPIVFAISANTPEAYRTAVRDGALSFNKILGDRIQVVDAPAGITAPHPSWNLIQWVDWETAGFAYADAQSDPRTGQILHAQVYLTSAFAIGSREQARNLLQRLLFSPTTSNHPLLTLKGFSSSRLCQHPSSLDWAQTVSLLLSEGVPDDVLLRVSQDHIREVVAHEIGHTLGLRHNFAGSTAAQVSLEERDRIFNAYLLKNEAPPPTLALSSSVMDYHVFADSVLLGQQLSASPQGLPYDARALQILYNEGKLEPEPIPLFCTDSGLDKDADCEAFDSGASVAESTLADTTKALKTLPYLLYEAFVALKSPPRDVEPKSVGSLTLDLDDLTLKTLRRRFTLVEALTPHVGLLKARKEAFEAVSSLNAKEAQEIQKKSLLIDIDSHGGFGTLLFRIPENWATESTARFNELLTKPQFLKGVGAGGKPYEFDSSDVSKMSNLAAVFFRSLQAKLHTEELRALRAQWPSTTQKKIDKKEMEAPERQLEFPELESSQRFAAFLGERAAQEIFSISEGTPPLQAEVTIPAKDEKPARKITVQFPRFRYPLAQRIAAANLLTSARGTAPDWAFFERTRLKERLMSLFQDQLGLPETDIDGTKMENFPPEVVRWILENQKVLAAFSAAT